jgi:hypothetical protein
MGSSSGFGSTPQETHPYLLDRWSRLKPSPHLRFIVLRTYSLPRLYYYTYCLFPNDDLIKTATRMQNWWLWSRQPTFDPDTVYKNRIRADRLAVRQPYGWNWLDLKSRTQALRVWWWIRAHENPAPWASLLRYASECGYLDRHWTQAYDASLRLKVVNGEGRIPELYPQPDQGSSGSIPTALVRFKDIKAALQLCPPKITEDTLTTGQKAIYSHPFSCLEDFSELLKGTQALPLLSAPKTWIKLALSHAAPGLQHGQGNEFCKLCAGNKKLDGRHLMDGCRLVQEFKQITTNFFRNHHLAPQLRRHGSWWPKLPKSKVLATFLIITLHVAWKARCSFRYENTSIIPVPRKFIRMVLDAYRQHVVVIERRLSHRKVGRKKHLTLDDWLIPGHLTKHNGFLTISL